MAAMTDVHRNITQLLLEEGVYSESDLMNLMGDCIDLHKREALKGRLKRTHEEAHDKKTLKAVVDRINEQLQPLQLKIAVMKSKQLSGEYETYYGLVNLNEHDGFAKQGWLNKSEQEFFHNIVEEILASDVCGANTPLLPLASRLSPLASHRSPLASRLSPLTGGRLHRGVWHGG